MLKSKYGGENMSFTELEEDNKYLDELGAEIVRCFDEKDVEGLKALFCSDEKNGNPELVSEIKYAFSIYEGKSQSFYVTSKSAAGNYTDDKHFTPHIRITTCEGKEYTISFLLYTIYQRMSINQKEKNTQNACFSCFFSMFLL